MQMMDHTRVYATCIFPCSSSLILQLYRYKLLFKASITYNVKMILLLALLFHSSFAYIDPAQIMLRVNNYRNIHQSPPVTYNTSLEVGAQAWADQHVLLHSSTINGENLAAGTGSFTWTNAIDLWYSENVLYNYSRPGFSGTTGHFTQLMWKSTTSIGLGSSVQNGVNYVVMWFYPAGNVLGQFEQNVFPKILSFSPSPRVQVPNKAPTISSKHNQSMYLQVR